MTITGLTTAIVPVGFRNAILTRIDTDEGVSGISEVVLKRRSKTVATAIDEAGRFLVGQDPRRIEDLMEKLYRDSFWVGGPLQVTPLSAIDMALWDLAGKRLGVPCYELFGGPTRDRVAVYGHCSCGPSPETFADNVEAAVKRGLHTVKTGLPMLYGAPDADWLKKAEPHGYFGAPGTMDRSLKETERIPGWTWDRIADFFAAARDRVGMAIDIALDCHGRLNVGNAKRLCAALEPFQLLFIEEPVPPENPEAILEVKRASTTPIAAGERVSMIYGAKPFLEREAVSLWQLDVCNCGGFSQARRIAALAEAHYIGIAPHNPNGPVATAESVQLAASIPNFTILETVGTEADLEAFKAVTPRPLVPDKGFYDLPATPGLGIEVHEECWSMGHDAPPFQGWR